MGVMRRQVWNEMNVAARDALMGRGRDDIFDPALRASIGELIDDIERRPRFAQASNFALGAEHTKVLSSRVSGA